MIRFFQKFHLRYVFLNSLLWIKDLALFDLEHGLQYMCNWCPWGGLRIRGSEDLAKMCFPTVGSLWQVFLSKSCASLGTGEQKPDKHLGEGHGHRRTYR